MITTIISALFVGLFVGVLARLILPGKQSIGIVMTILLGALGSAAGSWATYELGYANSNGGFAMIPFLAGAGVAVLLVALYAGLTGARKGTPVR